MKKSLWYLVIFTPLIIVASQPLQRSKKQEGDLLYFKLQKYDESCRRAKNVSTCFIIAGGIAAYLLSAYLATYTPIQK